MAHQPEITRINDSASPYYWGVDIGGTGIKLGLVDNNGQTLAYEVMPTRESEGPTAAVQHVAAVLREVENRLGVADKIARIGMGAPGPMDLVAGTLVAPPQLPSWWGFPIVEVLSKATQRPVSFVNDANAAAYGEFWLGSGCTDRSMVLLTLGTGVGGGVIVDNELVHGVNSFGSECGHILLTPAPDAQLCVWGGGRGHLEAYASASGVVQRTRQLLTEGRTSSLAGLLSKNNSELTAKKVYEAAKDGDELALEIVDETGRWLGVGVTSLIHTLDSGAVVLGGAMDFGGKDSPIGQRFVKAISDEFQSRTFPNVFEGTTIKFASLGADAGYLGAAGWARKEHASQQTLAQ